MPDESGAAASSSSVQVQGDGGEAATVDPIGGATNIWTPSTVALSLFLFLLAGLFEIGGGYLVFTGIRQRSQRSSTHTALYLAFGSLILICYGFIPVLQPSGSFGRIFAVYGGFFIVLSYAWGAVVDKMVLDVGDYVGCGISLLGVFIAWFYPR